MGNAEWRAARADYEAGMKRKAICEKYGCTYTALDNHVKREGWGKSRDTVKEQVTEKRTKIISDRIAVTEANNADIAADIKRHLLLRLKRTAAAFPDDATEVKITKKSKTTVYKLRDLTAAYKDLTGDMDTGEQAGNDLLQSLLDLERGRT